MSNPNPSNQWPKGVSGNPGGKPRLSEGVIEIKRLNRAEFEDLVNILLHTSVEELQNLANDKKNTAMTMMLASVIAKAIKYGDSKRVDFFLDRLIGKVPERFAGPNGEPMSFVGLVQLANQKKSEPKEAEKVEDGPARPVDP